jgi:hypothetical protein
MSIVKISELPAASSLNAGDELPANQSGITRKLTIGQIAEAVSPGSGGAEDVTSATNVTLTAASARVQTVIMTAANKAVVLPDATTLTEGGPIFVIRNRGNVPFFIKNSAGDVIAFVDGFTSATLMCLESATAKGRWGSTVAEEDIGYVLGETFSLGFSYVQTLIKTGEDEYLLAYPKIVPQDGNPGDTLVTFVHAAVLTVSDNVISVGQLYRIADLDNYISGPIQIAVLSPTKFMFAWSSGGNIRLTTVYKTGSVLTHDNSWNTDNSGVDRFSIVGLPSNRALLLCLSDNLLKLRVISYFSDTVFLTTTNTPTVVPTPDASNWNYQLSNLTLVSSVVGYEYDRVLGFYNWNDKTQFLAIHVNGNIIQNFTQSDLGLPIMAYTYGMSSGISANRILYVTRDFEKPTLGITSGLAAYLVNVANDLTLSFVSSTMDRDSSDPEDARFVQTSEGKFLVTYKEDNGEQGYYTTLTLNNDLLEFGKKRLFENGGHFYYSSVNLNTYSEGVIVSYTTADRYDGRFRLLTEIKP